MDARTDIPAHIYALANSDVNGLRLLVQQNTDTLSVSSEDTSLPADFRSIESAHTDSDPRCWLTPADEGGRAMRRIGTGEPRSYVIAGDKFRVSPRPDGTYSVVIRYYGAFADFSADSDTNAVLTTYPSLYLYAALKHAAVWAGDDKKMRTYAAAWDMERRRVTKEDRLSRYGEGLAATPARAT